MSTGTSAVPSQIEERILEDLNEAQRDAVVHGEGPLIIIAGAGTGKTIVSINIMMNQIDIIVMDAILSI